MTGASTETFDAFTQCQRMFSEAPSAIVQLEDDFPYVQLTSPETGATFALTFAHELKPGEEPDDGGTPTYWLSRLSDDEITQIQPGETDVPEWAIAILSSGIPIHPCCIFGYKDDNGTVVVILSLQSRDNGITGMSVMPLAGTKREQWPDFVGQDIGWWLWDLVKADRIIPLDDLIIQNPREYYWVDTMKLTGCMSMAVNHPVGAGYTVPRGVFAWFPVLTSGQTLPSVDVLLADFSALDMSYMFTGN